MKPLRARQLGFMLLTYLLPCAGSLSMSVQAQLPIELTSNIGNASTQTASYGITPSAGTQEFLLTTINPADSLPSDGSLGTTSATTDVTALNTYFGLATGTLATRNIQDGSGYLSQQVTLLAGAVVHFDYIFLTDEDTTAPTGYNNDQAFFTVNGVINSTLRTAGSLTADEQNTGTGSPNFDFQSVGPLTSGYTGFDYTVPTTGNYTFGFGVSDVTTNTVYSGLLIDNLQIVPEPSTWALLGVGAVSVGIAASRRRAHI